MQSNAVAAAIAATSAALFLPPHEVMWRGQLLDVRYIVLLGAMVRILLNTPVAVLNTAAFQG